MTIENGLAKTAAFAGPAGIMEVSPSQPWSNFLPQAVAEG